MKCIRFCELILLGLGICVCYGCGGGDTGPRTVPVTGTVTMKGSPAEGVTVSFLPEGDGQSAVGVTDSSGKYMLTTRVKDDGAVPGKYKVTLAKYEGQQQTVTDPSKAHADYDISNEYPQGYDESKAASNPSKNILPMKYADPTTSGFTADVVEGDKKFDFDIK